MESYIPLSIQPRNNDVWSRRNAIITENGIACNNTVVMPCVVNGNSLFVSFSLFLLIAMFFPDSLTHNCYDIMAGENFGC